MFFALLLLHISYRTLTYMGHIVVAIHTAVYVTNISVYMRLHQNALKVLTPLSTAELQTKKSDCCYFNGYCECIRVVFIGKGDFCISFSLKKPKNYDGVIFAGVCTKQASSLTSGEHASNLRLSLQHHIVQPLSSYL